MPYRLQKDESLASGLKRIAEEQLTGAIQQLQSSEDLNQSIYQARRCLKKARSLLRLLAPQLGPVYVEENRRLRDVARSFSSLRDAYVCLELLDKFTTQYKRKSTLNPQKQALQTKQAGLRQATDWLILRHQATEALSATRKRIEDWPLHTIGEGVLEAEAGKTHKESRRAFEKARRSRTVEDFHEFRKSVKRELNQTKLLEIDSDLDVMKQLSDLLGDHHNLAVLLLNVENSSRRFEAMVRHQLRQIEAEILEAAPQIYLSRNSAASFQIERLASSPATK